VVIGDGASHSTQLSWHSGQVLVQTLVAVQLHSDLYIMSAALLQSVYCDGCWWPEAEEQSSQICRHPRWHLGLAESTNGAVNSDQTERELCCCSIVL